MSRDADGLRKPIRVDVVYDDRAPRLSQLAPEAPAPQAAFRVRLCLVAFLGIFGLLFARLAHVSFGLDDEMRLIREELAAVPRPEVVDRDGRPLVMNTEGVGLAVEGRDVWDTAELVTALAAAFPSIDAGRLRQRTENKQYTLVLDSITPAQRQQAMSLGLPGLKFPRVTGRVYPQKDLAAHVVGYTIPGRGGAVGIERAIDRETLPGASETLTLSIDIVAQQILEDEILSAMQTYEAKAGWGVLLDVTNGEVVALASLPDFNPNTPGAVSPAAWRNRVLSDVYELGSAFKPITAAAALDAGVADLTERFDVSQPIEVGGWTIEDYSKKDHPLTVSEIVQYSSNIGSVKLAERLGRDAFVATLREVGLMDQMKTELLERRQPLYSKEWRPSEIAAASYGHGIAVSPLHLAAAFGATVNGGVYHTPTFLAGGQANAKPIFSDETSAAVRLMLRKTVTEGTGRNAEAVGYYPIGKTATADKPGEGGYSDDGPLISSFVGAFPGYDPKYVLLISLDEPQGTDATYGFATAGWVAAPVFKRVIERAAPALGLMPVGDDVAFDGFLGLRRQAAVRGAAADRMATLISETAP